MSCSQRKRWVCAQHEYINTSTKYDCTRICSFVISCPNKIKFTEQVLKYQKRTHAITEVNHASHSWDMSPQKFTHFFASFFYFSSFRTFAKKNCHETQKCSWITLKFGTHYKGWHTWHQVWWQNWQSYKRFFMKNDTNITAKLLFWYGLRPTPYHSAFIPSWEPQ